jgi:hypothetical protein
MDGYASKFQRHSYLVMHFAARYDNRMGMSIEEAVIAKLRELPPDKQQEVLDFAKLLGTWEKHALKSLEGLWAGHGVDISEEDITEPRREMWANFPRDIE